MSQDSEEVKGEGAPAAQPAAVNDTFGLSVALKTNFNRVTTTEVLEDDLAAAILGQMESEGLIVDAPVMVGNIQSSRKAMLVWSIEIKDWLRANIIKLYQIPLMVHLDGSFANDVRNDIGQQQFRNWVKPLTAHNEKLGFNHVSIYAERNLLQKPYYEYSEPSNQYSVSNYSALHDLIKQKNLVRFRNYSGAFNVNAAQIYAASVVKSRGVVSNKPPQMGGKPVFRGKPSDEVENQLRREIQQLEQDFGEQISSRELALARSRQETQAATRKIMDPEKMIGEINRVVSIGQQVLRQQMATDEIKYVNGMLDPFTPMVQGVRIPSLEPSHTIAFKDEQTMQINVGPSGQALIHLNFQALSIHPLMAWTPTTEFSLTQDPTIVEVPAQPGNSAANNEDINIQRVKAAFRVSNNANDEFADGNLKFMAKPVGLPLASKCRLVAGGLKISKTARFENESGRIRGIYVRRGQESSVSFSSIIDQQLSANNTYKGYVKDVSSYDAVYRPNCGDDVENFTSTRLAMQGFRDPQGDELLAAAQVGDYNQNYYGPAKFYTASSGRGPWNIISDWDNAESWTALDALDLYRNHSVLIMIEGVTPGMSFELDLIRHFEATPKDSGLVLERRSALLDKYSSSLELIRHAQPQQHIMLTQAFQAKQQPIYGDGNIWNLPQIGNVFGYTSKLVQGKPVEAVLLDAADDLLPTMGGLIADAVQPGAGVAVRTGLQLFKPSEAYQLGKTLMGGIGELDETDPASTTTYQNIPEVGDILELTEDHLASITQDSLMSSGDVESNPGPTDLEADEADEPGGDGEDLGKSPKLG